MGKCIFKFLFITELLLPSRTLWGADSQNFYQNYCKNHPQVWQGHYDLGNVNYQANKFEAAAQNYKQALDLCKDSQAQEHIFYNQGNCQYRQAQQEQDPKQKAEHLKESATCFESALALNPTAEDSKHNLEVVKKALKKLEEEQQQKNKQDKSEDKKDEDKKQNNPGANQNKNSPQDKENKENSNDNNGKGEPKDQQKSPEQSPKQDQNNPAPQPANSDKKEQAQASPRPTELKNRQEMENLLNSTKNDEKILPINFSNQPGTSSDSVLQDW